MGGDHRQHLDGLGHRALGQCERERRHGTLTYDLTGMAASGTNCSNAGPGKLTCSIGTLAAGTSDTLDVLVNTTGLPRAPPSPARPR